MVILQLVRPYCTGHIGGWEQAGGWDGNDGLLGEKIPSVPLEENKEILKQEGSKYLQVKAVSMLSLQQSSNKDQRKQTSMNAVGGMTSLLLPAIITWPI